MPTGIFLDNDTYNQTGGLLWAQQQAQNFSQQAQQRAQDGEDWAGQQLASLQSLGTPQQPSQQQSLTSPPVQGATSPPADTGPGAEPTATLSTSPLPEQPAATAQDLGQQWADNAMKTLSPQASAPAQPPPPPPPPTTDTATTAQDYGQAWADQQTQNVGTSSDAGQALLAAPPGNTAGQSLSAPDAQSTANGPSGQQWLQIAENQLSKPYIWGSKGGRSDFSADPAGFDCSGFVSYVMKTGFGVDLPAYTGSAYTQTRALAAGEQPRPGDVAFYNMDSSDPHEQHIALYIGNGQIIQAGGTREDVNIAPADQPVGSAPEYRRPTALDNDKGNALAQTQVGTVAQSASSPTGSPSSLSPTAPVTAPLSVSSGKVPAGLQPAQPGDLIDQARQAATNAGIDPDIFTRQIQQESGFNPNAKSKAGAVGIAQFMPGTAQGLGIDPTNPQQSLQAAANLDAQNLQKYNGDWSKTLAAYNAGGGAVDQYSGVPPFQETQNYINSILGGAQGVVQQVSSTLGNAGSALATTGGNFGQSVNDAYTQLLNNGQNAINQFGTGLNQDLTGLGTGAQNALGGLQGYGTDLLGNTQNLLNQGNTLLSGQPQSLADQLSQNLLNQTNNATTGLQNFGQQVGTGLSQDFSNLGTTLQNLPDQYMQQQEINNPNSLYNQQQQALGNLLTSQGLPTPASVLGAPDPNSALGQLQAGQQLGPGGQAQATWEAAQRYEGWKNALVAQANPLANVPLVGGLTTLAGQVALDPTTLAMGPAGSLADLATQGIGNTALRGLARAGLEGAQVGGLYGAAQPGSTPFSALESAAAGGVFGTGLNGLGQVAPLAARALTSDQAQALLRARQSGQADVNFALGGLPGIFGAGASVPTTGASQLGRVLDALGAYPDEIAQPIRQFAAQAEAPASEIANTVQRWMVDNPLESVPSPTAGSTTEEVTQAGQQAVTDIAQGVAQALRGGPFMPTGTMPGQIGLEGMPTDISQTAPTAQPLSDVSYPMDVAPAPAEPSVLEPGRTYTRSYTPGLQNAPAQTRTLTSDAQQLLQSIDNGATVPPMSRELRDLAESNGVPVPLLSPTEAAVTPQQVIDQLRGIQGQPYGSMQEAASAMGAQQSAAARALQAQQVAQGFTQSDADLAAAGIQAAPGQAAQAAGKVPVRGSPDVWQTTLPNTDPNGLPTLGDIWKTYHVGSLVSGPQTVAKVAMNSIVSPLWNLMTGGFYDLATFQPSRAQGAFVGLQSSWSRFLPDLKQGYMNSFSNPELVSSRYAQAGFSGRAMLARLFETPQAVHAGLQNLAADTVARMELGRMAGTEATRQGLTGYDWFNGVQDLIDNPKPGWMDTAAGVGKRAALTGDLGAFGRAMESHIQAWGPIGNWIWPVFRIGMNWLTQRVEQSPIGLVGSAIDVAKGLRGEGPYAGPAGQAAKLSDILPALRGETATMSPEARQALAQNPFVHPSDWTTVTNEKTGTSFQRQPTAPLRERFQNNLAGTGVAIAAALAGADGTITGAGPEDDTQRQNLLAQGWQPYSVKIGDNYVNYQHLPGGLAMALVGNYFDAVNYPSKAEQQQILAGRYPLGTVTGPGTGAQSRVDYAAERYIKSMFELTGSQAGLTQLGDMIDAITTGSAPNAAGAALGGFAEGTLPFSAALSSVASATDPYRRQPSSLSPVEYGVQSLAENIPGLRQAMVPVAQTPLGEPQPNPQGGLRALAPMPTRAVAGNPILAAVAMSGSTIGQAPDSIPYGRGREILLTPDEQRTYQQAKGDLINQVIGPMIQSGDWQRMGAQPGGTQIQADILRRAEPGADRYAQGMLLSSMDPNSAWTRSTPSANNFLYPRVGYEPQALAQAYLGQQMLQQQMAQHENFMAAMQAQQPLIKGIPAMASGGIVTQPTVALIGESGPEAVVPLTNSGTPSVQESLNRIGQGASDPSAVAPQQGDIQNYIDQAARARGIDPVVAMSVAYNEGGRDPNNPDQPAFSNPAVRGTFNTGSSWWPFQLHYGGNGYDQYGNVAGLGNEFTAQTGFQPGDPAAWRQSVDFALDTALKRGWYPTWYGSKPAGVTQWQGIPNAPQQQAA